MSPDRSFSLLIDASHKRLAESASRAVSSDVVKINQEVTDDVLAYVLDFQRAYSALRRLVGLVAGMLLLSQTSRKVDAVDWSAIGGARDTWKEAESSIQSLLAHRCVERNLHHLERAHRLIGSCLTVLGSPEQIANGANLQAALRNVAEAYRHLCSASLPGLGITMVDFSHACCGCHGQSELASDELGRK
jgi:hypothetical protein